jgi:hypothetical protein
MHLPVLIEPVAGNGFRATGGPPFILSAEGATREEALQKLRQAIARRLETGAEIVSLEIPESEHPLAPFAGMFKDNPLFDEWQQAMAEYRRQVDEEAEAR